MGRAHREGQLQGWLTEQLHTVTKVPGSFCLWSGACPHGVRMMARGIRRLCLGLLGGCELLCWGHIPVPMWGRWRALFPTATPVRSPSSALHVAVPLPRNLMSRNTCRLIRCGLQGGAVALSLATLWPYRSWPSTPAGRRMRKTQVGRRGECYHAHTCPLKLHGFYSQLCDLGQPPWPLWASVYFIYKMGHSMKGGTTNVQ